MGAPTVIWVGRSVERVDDAALKVPGNPLAAQLDQLFGVSQVEQDGLIQTVNGLGGGCRNHASGRALGQINSEAFLEPLNLHAQRWLQRVWLPAARVKLPSA